MSAHPGDLPEGRPAPPIGPALSRSTPPAPAPAPSGALPPFAPFARSAAVEEEAAPREELVAPVEAAEVDDLPWLTLEEEETPVAAAVETPPAAEEAPTAPAGEEEAEELPEWLSWVEEAGAPAVEATEPAQPAPAPQAVAVEEAPVAELPAPEEAAAALPAPEAPVEEPAAAGVAPGDVEPALAGALGEVADHLERISRALRESPGEVLGGGAGRDPLELLVAGFVLGYAQGQRRG